MGHLSLREAVVLANNSVGTIDNITFSPTVFVPGTTIHMDDQPVIITDPVNIMGLGAERLILDGSNVTNAITVDVPFFVGSPVSIGGMTVTHAGWTGNSFAGSGIMAYDDAITLDHVVMTQNFGGVFIGGTSIAAGPSPSCGRGITHRH